MVKTFALAAVLVVLPASPTWAARADTVKTCMFYPDPKESPALYDVPLGTPCDRMSYEVFYQVDQLRWPRPTIETLAKQYRLLKEVDGLDCVLQSLLRRAMRKEGNDEDA